MHHRLPAKFRDSSRPKIIIALCSEYILSYNDGTANSLNLYSNYV